MPEPVNRGFAAFVPGRTPPPSASGQAHWFVFRDGRILVAREGEAVRDPVMVPFAGELESLGLHPGHVHFLGMAGGSPCLAAEVPVGDEPPAGWSFEGLRSLFRVVDEDLFSVAGRATQVLDWDQTHRFCGRCGAPTVEKQDERAKLCPACGLTSYPRISPAVIVAVTRGREILLARANRFAPGLYSVLAGFVEPGETLEDCVMREVKEETGIEVTNVRYFGSQPWPFPNSLMVAFTADHAAGAITIDPGELADAGWYTPEGLPRIPDRLTVARRLIDWFVESRRG
jgi:NAD+ diphosphatase